MSLISFCDVFAALIPVSVLRWSGGAGSGPPVAQGLQHRLRGLHQGRGGGRRGRPPGGGRLKQPENLTLFRLHIKQAETKTKRCETEKEKKKPTENTTRTPPLPARSLHKHPCFLL